MTIPVEQITAKGLPPSCTSRSAFIRSALRLALRRHKITRMEQQHAEGYARHPIEPGEFDVWESEQA